MVDVEVALSEYFAGNDNDSGVSQWGCGWQFLSWSGKDIRIILEDDSGMIQPALHNIIVYAMIVISYRYFSGPKNVISWDRV